MHSKEELQAEIKRLEGLCQLKEEAFQAVYDELHADGLSCPACGDKFHDIDIETYPNDYTQCGCCGAVSHTKCHGPIFTNPPQYIMIGNYQYLIEYPDTAILTIEGEELYGTHSFARKKIEVSKNRKNDWGLTLLHEIFHAVDEMSGDTLAEPDVARLSTMLYGVLKSNTRLTDYMFGYHGVETDNPGG